MLEKPQHPMSFAEQLKSQVDIVRTIGEYVRLKRTGSSARYTGLCPFHNEKTPSFSVHATHQFYYCFGCQAKGDVIRFVMEMDGLTFPEALNALAERNGLPMPERQQWNDPEAKLRAALFDMHELAAQVFQQNLTGGAGAEARRYIAERGVRQTQAEEFRLGFSDPGGQQLFRRLAQEGFSPEQMEASGLVRRRQEGGGSYDAFRGRLMFPIQNESGKVIAFGGRALRFGDEPKYLNSPETPIYHKAAVLFNLHRAKDSIRKQGFSILVEGYMDVIGVWMGGVEQVVATCGTALTPGQVRTLKRHAEHIIVNFDPDAAGARASERSIQILLDEGMRVRVLELEGGLDPDEYVKEHGGDLYRQRLRQSPGYFFWLADRARKKFDLRSPEGKVDAWRYLQTAVQRVPGKVERAAIANDVAVYLGVEATIVREQMRGGVAGAGEEARKPAAPQIPAMERLLLNALLACGGAALEPLGRLRGLAACKEFVSWPIFEVLLGMAGRGEPVTYGELEQKLADPERALLSRLLFADEAGDEQKALAQAQECVAKLEQQEQERRRGDLRLSVQHAERRGDLSEALRLAEELNEMTKAGRGSS